MKVTLVRRSRHLHSVERPFLWLLPAVLLLIAYSLYPFVFNLFISFHRFDPVTKSFVWNFPGNWIELFANGDFLKTFRTTVILGLMSLLVELLLGVLIAVAFDQHGVKLRSVWQTMLTLPMVVPPVITGLMFRFLQNADYGIISNLLYAVGLIDRSEPLIGGTGKNVLMAILIAEVWQWTPFVALIVLAGLKALPIEPIEAAVVDGANKWQLFWQIKLPLLKGVLSIVVLFRTVDLLRLFDYVAIMTSGGPGGNSETLSHYAYRMHKSVEWGMVAVSSLVILLLAVLVTNAYMRFFKVRI